MTSTLTTQTAPRQAPAAASGSTPEHHRHLVRSRIKSTIKHTVLIACSVLMIYPLLWMLVSSFRPTNVIFRTPGLWLNNPTLSNYIHGWTALSSPFGRYLINSGIVVIG